MNYNNENLILKENEQVMMSWERGYMEACVDKLEPWGDILEIGWGCGYSASQFMKYPFKSYTVIECEDIVIKKAKEWAKSYDNVTIIEGTWQEKLNILGKFDIIFFDDYPLNINKENPEEILICHKRLNIFVDLIIQNHTKIGSRISFYMNGNENITLSSDTEPFITKEFTTMNIIIPKHCDYRNLEEQKVTIPLITIVKEYNFQEAQQWALKEINLFKIKV